jgi:riboflavin kinase/FMN adenylyltransferase
MKPVYHSLEELPAGRKMVLAIGFFDGVHLGHQKLIEAACRLARDMGADTGIITMSPHPSVLLHPDMKREYVETEEEKIGHLQELPVSHIVVLPVTEKFLQEEPDDFLRQLSQIPGLCGLVCGENFTFGRMAAGTPERMRQFFSHTDVKVEVIPLLRSDILGGKAVSSTEIKKLIRSGDVDKAAALLGRHYETKGSVVHGFHRGTDVLGFPTANLEVEEGRVLPCDGVYATYAVIHGQVYPAVTNIGTNPTFGSGERTIETFIISFEGNIYNQPFAIDWVKRLRGEIRFGSAEELKAQIEKDVETARKILH